LSEQLSPEPLPASQEPLEIQSVGDDAEPAAASTPTSRTKWIAPAWFLFGILVGVIGFALYTTLMTRAAVPTAASGALDAVALRSAARDGTLDAIATLEARGAAAQQQQQPQGPQVVADNTFSVRDANRQGDPNAKVTIYEFSDFQ
jgi:hypothetical protein